MLRGAAFERVESESLSEMPVCLVRFERRDAPSSQSERVSSGDLRLFWDVTGGDSLAWTVALGVDLTCPTLS